MFLQRVPSLSFSCLLEFDLRFVFVCSFDTPSMDDWNEALEKVPSDLRQAIFADGYSSAEAIEECFQNEERLEKYLHGLLFVRKALTLEGVTEDTLDFSRPMGAMRKLLRVAKASVARVDQENRRAQEIHEVEELQRAKVQAKEGAKEAAKDKKRIDPGEKIRLEEQLGRQFLLVV